MLFTEVVALLEKFHWAQENLSLHAPMSRAVWGSLPSLASNVKPESSLYYVSHQKQCSPFSDSRALALMSRKVNQQSWEKSLAGDRAERAKGSMEQAVRLGERPCGPRFSFLANQGTTLHNSLTSLSLGKNKKLGQDPRTKSHAMLFVMLRNEVLFYINTF